MSEMDKLKEEAQAENKRLMQEMLASAEEYAKKIEGLEKMYMNQFKSLKEQKEQETKVRLATRTKIFQNMCSLYNIKVVNQI